MPVATQARVSRDLTVRTFEVRSGSWDDKTRSFELIISTEAPVMVMDLQRWEPVDEVLVSAGCKLPKSRQVPLLDSHNRWSVKEAQLGSAREIKPNQDQVSGRAYLASTEEDVAAKVREGHITDCSAGYQVVASQRIERGESAEIGGRVYTASPNRALRVTTEWLLKEVSLCPIGADEDAKVREESAGGPPAQQKEDSIMADLAKVVTTPAAPAAQPVAAVEAPVRAEAPKPEIAEEILRRRVLAVTPHEFVAVAEQALMDGKDFDGCRAAVREAFAKAREVASGTPEPVKPGAKTPADPAQPTRLADVSATDFARALRG
jgi:hypothetical protein